MPLAYEPEQLVELQRFAALGKLLANVAHEFSTPAAALASNADLEIRLVDALEKTQPTGPAQELLATLRNLLNVDRVACERIRDLVKSLKTVARARAAEFERVDLNELAKSMVQLVATGFRTGIRFETDFGTLPTVECDPSLLAQALLNLINNAAQSIDGTGSVTVGTRAEGSQIHLWIADTGCGIQPEDQPKVLKQSFTTKPVGVGTGLGLAIVSDAVRRVHGGTVEFESVSGQGSTFHIRIPVDHSKVATES